MSNPHGHFKDGNYDLSSDQIFAHGVVKTRLGIIWFVGVICSILSIGGLCAFYLNPDKAKDIWVIIGPIISAAVSGTVAFFAGEMKGRSE